MRILTNTELVTWGRERSCINRGPVWRGRSPTVWWGPCKQPYCVGGGALLIGALCEGAGVPYGAPLYGGGPVHSSTVLGEGLGSPYGTPPYWVPYMEMELHWLGGSHVKPTVWWCRRGPILSPTEGVFTRNEIQPTTLTRRDIIRCQEIEFRDNFVMSQRSHVMQRYEAYCSNNLHLDLSPSTLSLHSLRS